MGGLPPGVLSTDIGSQGPFPPLQEPKELITYDTVDIKGMLFYSSKFVMLFDHMLVFFRNLRAKLSVWLCPRPPYPHFLVRYYSLPPSIAPPTCLFALSPPLDADLCVVGFVGA